MPVEGLSDDAAAAGAPLEGRRAVAMRRNLALNYAYSAVSSLASSIVMGQFLATYIYNLPDGSNDRVGYISATAGCVMVMLTLPIGLLTDRIPRSRMLSLAGASGIAASGAMAWALVSGSWVALYAAAAVNGAYQALCSSPLSSIVADSTGGDRTRVLVVSYAISLLASSAGPIIALIYFWRVGDTWSAALLRDLLHIGNAIACVSAVLLFFFSDVEEDTGWHGGGTGAEGEAGALDAPLLRKSQGVSTGSSDELLVRCDGDDANEVLALMDGPNADAGAPVVGAKRALDTAGTAGSSGPAEEGATGSSGPAEEEDGGTSATQNLGHQSIRVGCCTLKVVHIPTIIFTSDMLIAVGAGMTVQFFSLFFANDFDLSPLGVSAIYAVSPLFIALLSLASMPLSRVLGRAGTSVLMDALGTACLIGLAVPGPLLLDIPLFLLRTAAMNASYPTQRAIMMDVVPKAQRGWWNSLEGITSFTWTGSAALGGWLIDSFDYRFTFRITAIMYVSGTLVLLLLIPLTRGEVVPVRGRRAR